MNHSSGLSMRTAPGSTDGAASSATITNSTACISDASSFAMTTLSRQCNTYLTESVRFDSAEGLPGAVECAGRLLDTKIARKMKKLRYWEEIDRALVCAGSAEGYRPMFEYLLCRFSRPVTLKLRDLGYMVSPAMSTPALVAITFQVSREVLGLVPGLPLYAWAADRSRSYVMLKARFLVCFMDLVRSLHNHLLVVEHATATFTLPPDGVRKWQVASSVISNLSSDSLGTSGGSTGSHRPHLLGGGDATTFGDDLGDSLSSAGTLPRSAGLDLDLDDAASVDDGQSAGGASCGGLRFDFWIGSHARKGTWSWDDNDARHAEPAYYG